VKKVRIFPLLGDRYWDVRVTNPDGSTGVFEAGFIVKPK